MTVQNLIDELQEVEDKSLPVFLELQDEKEDEQIFITQEVVSTEFWISDYKEGKNRIVLK